MHIPLLMPCDFDFFFCSACCGKFGYKWYQWNDSGREFCKHKCYLFIWYWSAQTKFFSLSSLSLTDAVLGSTGLEYDILGTFSINETYHLCWLVWLFWWMWSSCCGIPCCLVHSWAIEAYEDAMSLCPVPLQFQHNSEPFQIFPLSSISVHLIS